MAYLGAQTLLSSSTSGGSSVRVYSTTGVRGRREQQPTHQYTLAQQAFTTVRDHLGSHCHPLPLRAGSLMYSNALGTTYLKVKLVDAFGQRDGIGAIEFRDYSTSRDSEACLDVRLVFKPLWRIPSVESMGRILFHKPTPLHSVEDMAALLDFEYEAPEPVSPLSPPMDLQGASFEVADYQSESSTPTFATLGLSRHVLWWRKTVIAHMDELEAKLHTRFEHVHPHFAAYSRSRPSGTQLYVSQNHQEAKWMLNADHCLMLSLRYHTRDFESVDALVGFMETVIYAVQIHAQKRARSF
jgi:hypothetical protein